MKVLYVEDDPAARKFVEKGLGRKGFEVSTADSIAAGVARARSGEFDALIIDVSLPDGDGFELLRQLRAAGVQTPALFLSARGAVSERLRGFETGADDYVPKPFALDELAARTRAIVRRGSRQAAEILRVADLEMNLTAHKVSRGGRPIELPLKQYVLLELLLRNRGQVVPRRAIIERLWAGQPTPRDNALNVQASCLRKQLEAPGELPLIHTVRGVGYLLDEPGSEGGKRPPQD